MVVLGGGAVSYERGTPEQGLLEIKGTHRPQFGPQWGPKLLGPT